MTPTPTHAPVPNTIGLRADVQTPHSPSTQSPISTNEGSPAGQPYLSFPLPDSLPDVRVIIHLSREVSQLTSQLEEANKKLKQAQDGKQNEVRLRQHFQEPVSRLESENQALRHQLTAVNHQLASLQHSLNLSREECGHLRDHCATLQKRLEHTEHELEATRQELVATRQQLEETRSTTQGLLAFQAQFRSLCILGEFAIRALRALSQTAKCSIKLLEEMGDRYRLKLPPTPEEEPEWRRIAHTLKAQHPSLTPGILSALAKISSRRNDMFHPDPFTPSVQSELREMAHKSVCDDVGIPREVFQESVTMMLALVVGQNTGAPEQVFLSDFFS